MKPVGKNYRRNIGDNMKDFVAFFCAQCDRVQDGEETNEGVRCYYCGTFFEGE